MERWLTRLVRRRLGGTTTLSLLGSALIGVACHDFDLPQPGETPAIGSSKNGDDAGATPEASPDGSVGTQLVNLRVLARGVPQAETALARLRGPTRTVTDGGAEPPPTMLETETMTDGGADPDLKASPSCDPLPALDCTPWFWTGGVVPYRFEDSVSANTRARVRESFEAWAATNMQFVIESGQSRFIRIEEQSGTGCIALPNQQLWVVDPEGCDAGDLARDVGLLLRLPREDQRSDRDVYLEPASASCTPPTAKCGWHAGFGALGRFQYSSMTTYPASDEAPRFVDALGLAFPAVQEATSPSLIDMLNVHELYAEALGWGPFIRAGMDTATGERPSPYPSEGVSLVGDPVLVRDAFVEGQLAAFARGSDNGLYVRKRTGLQTESWSTWEAIGDIGSDPAVAVSSPGQIKVFALRSGSELEQRDFDGQVWSEWVALEGPVVSYASVPAVAAEPGGRLTLVVRGEDNAIWANRWEDQWQGWVSLGGTFTGRPAATSGGEGRVDIAARSALNENEFWLRAFSPDECPAQPDHWCDWSTLPTVNLAPEASPAMTSDGVGQLDIFVRSLNSGLWHVPVRTGVAIWWQPLGGSLLANPSAISWPGSPRRIEVAAAIEDWAEPVPNAELAPSLWLKAFSEP